MRTASLGFAMLLASQSFAQDPERGRQLYDTHCGDCHYVRVHERERSRSLVHTIAELREQVARYAAQTRHRFTREDIEDLVAYLNDSHYRLEK
jgi:mono/diheme cytochrome c family protein